MITTKKFFWYSVAAGLSLGLAASQIDFFRTHFWLDNLTSPLMSYMRSRDCQRVDALLRADCERAHARAIDPAVVAAADALDREQAQMRLAVRAASLPGPMVRYQAGELPAAWHRRDAALARFDGKIILQREVMEMDEADQPSSSRLRLTHMVPVSTME